VLGEELCPGPQQCFLGGLRVMERAAKGPSKCLLF
jgi:hypothetical protein